MVEQTRSQIPDTSTSGIGVTVVTCMYRTTIFLAIVDPASYESSGNKVGRDKC